MTRRLFIGARIFDGEAMHDRHALLTEDGRICAILPEGEAAPDADIVALSGGILAPGFVDLQVNGGGGVMLNDAPSPGTMARIAEAHATLGSTTILPTLITDTPERTEAAIDAALRAVAEGVPGIGGLHLEGPHLAAARRGAHDAGLIRPMTGADLARLTDAADRLPTLIVTLAPEAATEAQIAALAEAGAIVSLGHTDASYETAMRAAAAGATMATHLYNAMSPLGHRAPGTVGAVLDGAFWAGIIADGVHVHEAALRIALAAKRGRMFLVTDAMAPAGTDLGAFSLSGRVVRRAAGRLTLEDGTLAGADLDLPRALRVVRDLGLGLGETLSLATSAPADAVGRADMGRLAPGHWADLVHVTDELHLAGVWRRGC